MLTTRWARPLVQDQKWCKRNNAYHKYEPIYKQEYLTRRGNTGVSGPALYLQACQLPHQHPPHPSPRAPQAWGWAQMLVHDLHQPTCGCTPANSTPPWVLAATTILQARGQPSPTNLLPPCNTNSEQLPLPPPLERMATAQQQLEHPARWHAVF